MNSKKYKYDVAFSFLAQDEERAFLINELIKDRTNNFIYSDRQKELAGKDGMESFSKVFEKEACIVVIILRKEWGNTKWTRLEQTAIKNRGLEKGFDFVFPIIIADRNNSPEWLPKPKIWYDLDRFGVKGAAAAIEERLKEIGVELKEETSAELGMRKHRMIEAEKKRMKFLNSGEGVRSADNEVIKLFNEIKKVAKEIEKKENTRIPVKIESVFVRLDYDNYIMILNWISRCVNSLNDARLKVRVLKKEFMEEVQLEEVNFLFDQNLAGTLGWKEETNENILLNCDKMVRRCLEIFFNTIQEDGKEDIEYLLT